MWLWVVLGLAADPVVPADPAAPVDAPATADPTVPTEADPPDEPVDAGTVVVWSDFQIKLARDAVIQAAKEAGYTQMIRRDDRVVMRHGYNYRGDVVVHNDGRVEVKRQPIQFEPWVGGSSPARWLSCVLVPLCIRPGGQTVSQRRFRSYQRDALEAVADEAQSFGDKMSTAGLGKKLESLPARLDDLWEHGIPIDGGSVLPTARDRRMALLAYWDTRTETQWGEAVRDLVERYLQGVVQPSAEPVTPAELEAFNLTRTASRPLVLTMP